jgi:uncharacterized protein (TIGR03067 family)
MWKRMPVILVSGLLVGAGATTDAAKSELKKLQGTWKVVSLTAAGKPLPAEQWKGLQIVIKGHEMSFMGKTMPIKIDPTTKPKALDLTITRGDEKIDWKCIYSLEGDTLKFLMPLAPKKGQKNVGERYGSVKRPESFKTENKPFMVFTAEREKK